MEPIDVRTILLWLRAIALGGQVSTLLAAILLYGDRLPLAALFSVPLLYALWHAGLLWRLKARAARGDASLGQGMLTLEITIDLLAVSALLYLAGGWTNPFTPMLLVPLAFAAAVLPWRRALLLTAFAFASYALLVRWHLPLPSVNERFGGDFNVHVLGMWASFVIAACVLVGAVALVRAALERERRALAREREARLRDEQLVAIGALAASAAHELGTPLGTARLIAEELEGTLQGELKAQAEVLARQLDAASDRLRLLVRGALADAAPGPAGGGLTLHGFLVQLVGRFEVLRPDVQVQVRGDALPELPLRDVRLLESGLLGLLTNAADAQRDATQPRIDLETTIAAGTLHIRIRDYGTGIADDRALLGRAPLPPSEGGLGVGWVISSATFERHGGHASVTAAEPGTCVDVALPLAQLARADTLGREAGR